MIKKPIHFLIIALSSASSWAHADNYATQDTEYDSVQYENSQFVSPNQKKHESTKEESLPTASNEDAKKKVFSQADRFNALLSASTKAVVSNRVNGEFQFVELNAPDDGETALDDLVTQDDLEDAEMEKRRLQAAEETLQTGKGLMTKAQLQAQTERIIFPVTTKMKPTKLPSRKISIDPDIAKTIQRPIAVIGTDEYSLEWYRINLGAIRRLGAVVVVTSIKNMQDFQMIKSFAPDIQMEPMDAENFLKIYGVSLYPIILTQQGALQ